MAERITECIWAVSERHRTLHRRRLLAFSRPGEPASAALCGVKPELGVWVMRPLQLITHRGYFPCRQCEKEAGSG